MIHYHITDNTAAAIPLRDIPEVSYADFYDDLCVKLADPRYHLAHYFALPEEGRMRFYALLLDDVASQVLVTSFATDYYRSEEHTSELQSQR